MRTHAVIIGLTTNYLHIRSNLRVFKRVTIALAEINNSHKFGQYTMCSIKAASDKSSTKSDAFCSTKGMMHERRGSVLSWIAK